MKRIILDIDGVLVDFVKGASLVHGFDPSIIDTWNFFNKIGISESEFWGKIDEHGPEFWSDLEDFEWTDELLSECFKHCQGTTLVSSPSNHHHSVIGKKKWIKDKLGHGFKQYLLGSYKEACAHDDSILIDDSDANCEKFLDAGGKVILFPQPWNQNSYLVNDRIGYTKDLLMEFFSG